MFCMADDPNDFLKAFADTLADVSGVASPPEGAVQHGKLIYMGFDDAIRTAIRQNLGDTIPVEEVADLPALKQYLVNGEAALLVFDSTSFIRPGIAITRFVKERNLSVRVAHIYGAQRVTEEYEKYRQYQVHLQPDYRATTDELFMVIDAMQKDLVG